MTKLQKLGIIIPLVIAVAAPMMGGLVADAQESPPSGSSAEYPGQAPIKKVSTVKTIAENILGWVYTFFFIAAAVMILVAAFQYLTARGEEEKVKKAKNNLLYAVIAIAIALVAMGIDNIIASLMGAQAPPMG